MLVKLNPTIIVTQCVLSIYHLITFSKVNKNGIHQRISCVYAFIAFSLFNFVTYIFRAMNLQWEKSEVLRAWLGSLARPLVCGCGYLCVLHFNWVNICQWFKWLCMTKHGTFHGFVHNISYCIVHTPYSIFVMQNVAFALFEVIILKLINRPRSACACTPWVCVAQSSWQNSPQIHIACHIIQTKAQWLEIDFKNLNEFPTQLYRIHSRIHSGPETQTGILDLTY